MSRLTMLTAAALISLMALSLGEAAADKNPAPLRRFALVAGANQGGAGRSGFDRRCRREIIVFRLIATVGRLWCRPKPNYVSPGDGRTRCH